MPRPCCAAVPTVVGSFPHTDARALADCILARFTAMPTWPQMPARDWRESMYVQYSEGLPGAVVDGPRARIYFRGDETLFAGNWRRSTRRWSRRTWNASPSAGVRPGIAPVPRSRPAPRRRRPNGLKGQVTGPFSFAMTVTDENKRALAYTPELHEVAVQGMAMKARWLARQLRREARGRTGGARRAVSLFVRFGLRQRVAAGCDCGPRRRGGGDSPGRRAGRAALLRKYGLVPGAEHGPGRDQFRRL